MKVLIVYSDIKCSCTRKNTFEVGKALSETQDVKILFYKKVSEKDFLENDVIIIQRLGANGGMISQKDKEFFFPTIEKYKTSEYEKAIIYNIDDLILTHQNNTPIEFILRVDGVIVPNESYTKSINPYNQNVYFTRTWLDTESIDKIPNDFKLPKNKIKLLWCTTRKVGNEFMHHLIPFLAKNIPEAIIYCVGNGSNEFKNYPQTQTFPIVTFEAFIKFIKASDIVLNPVHYGDIKGLNDKEFLDCKSEIKYLNAAYCKKPFISSPSAPYKFAVKNGINGYLLENNIYDWYESIKAMMTNQGLKRNIIENAYSDILDNYSFKSLSKNLIRIFENIFEKKFDLAKYQEI